MSMYYTNGPALTMHASSGSTGFEVPIERTGHSFTFNWKATPGGTVNSTSAYPMGFVTSSPVTGTNADVFNAAIRSLLVTAYTPSSYTSGGSSYTSSTYTSVPFSCVEWWLVDTTANQYSTHANGTPAQNTPGQNVNLRSTIWTQIDAGANRYFTIPDSRLGHALVAGSVAGGWSPVTQGYYTFGTYSGGTTGTQVPLHWFVGSAPVVPGDFSIADRTDGTKAPLNQTNVSNMLWNHDYTVYPLASVTFYLPTAEVNNLYVLHYQIPGQVAAAMSCGRRRSVPG